MNFIGEVLNNIADAVDELELYANIVYGSDPPENGICMLQGAGFPEETHLNKGMMYQLPVVLNGKNSDLQVVMDALTEVHKALTKVTDYSDFSTDEVQVVNIETTASPSVIGREQNSQWIVGSSFEVYFYWR